MAKGAIDCESAIVTHYQATKLRSQALARSTIQRRLYRRSARPSLRRWPNAIFLVRADQFAAALPQAFSQRIAVVGFLSNHPRRFRPWPARVMTPPYPDGRERRFREPDFRRGCGVKVVSQRNTAAVDHHHPLRHLAPLVFPTPQLLFSREQNPIQKRFAPL